MKKDYIIVTLDWKGRVHLPELADRKNVYSLMNSSIPLAMRAIQGAKLVIAPDSWSKYAAALSDTPQVVLFSDIRCEYFKTFDFILDGCFIDLRERKEVSILGLSGSRGNYSAVPNVNFISWQEVLETSRRKLDLV